MKTLWPRTEPLLAEAIEPSLTIRRPAWPVVTQRAVASLAWRLPATAARAALAVALVWGWIRAMSLRARHVPMFDQIVPGAPCAQKHWTPRPPLRGSCAVSAAGRLRAGPARVPEERFHVRRERSGGPPGFRRTGCRGAAGPRRGRAGPERGRRGRHRCPQAAATWVAGWAQSPPPLIGQSWFG